MTGDLPGDVTGDGSDGRLTRFPCELTVTFVDGHGDDLVLEVTEIAIGTTADGRPVREIETTDDGGRVTRHRLRDDLAAAAPANAVAFRRLLAAGDGETDQLTNWA